MTWCDATAVPAHRMDRGRIDEQFIDIMTREFEDLVDQEFDELITCGWGEDAHGPGRGGPFVPRRPRHRAPVPPGPPARPVSRRPVRGLGRTPRNGQRAPP